MSKLRCHIAISLDGFVAGPNQSDANPLGEGGERLHEWLVPLAAWRESHGERRGEVNESTRIFEESCENIGVRLWGGGDIAQQYLAAGLLDELELHTVPVLLGDGARLFDNLGAADARLAQVRAVEAPGVTHLKYRVVT
jgi:hypothetical protein